MLLCVLIFAPVAHAENLVLSVNPTSSTVNLQDVYPVCTSELVGQHDTQTQMRSCPPGFTNIWVARTISRGEVIKTVVHVYCNTAAGARYPVSQEPMDFGNAKIICWEINRASTKPGTLEIRYIETVTGR